MTDAQDKLIDAIYHPHHDNGFDQQALSVYRRNLEASAIRALEITFPTINELAGEDFFRYLATRFLKHTPFNEGDWGLWGDQFPNFLSQDEEASNYPYFSDIATLDWYAHSMERDTDITVDNTSFELLSTTDANELAFVFSPLLHIVKSAFPAVDIYQAHQDTDNRQALIARAKEKMENNEGQIALIHRPHYKALIEDLSEQSYRHINAFLHNTPIAQALESLDDSEFSFEEWIGPLVGQKIVTGIKLLK